jgi:phosphate transport system substrate-binding protein
MRFFQSRMFVFVVLLLLLLSPAALVAQDQGITAVGSAIVEDLLAALVEASGTELEIAIESTGTTTGLAQLCSGEADLTSATRPITDAERAACAESGVVPIELLLGHNILALVINAGDDIEACLTAEEANTIFAPSAQGEITNWNQVLDNGPERDLTVYVPEELSAEFAILDSLIEGDGIRADAVVESDAGALASAVGSTPGAIGVMTLSQATASEEAIRILDLDAASVQGCQSPTAAAVEDNLYPAADSLYLYANTDLLQADGADTLLEYISSTDAAEVVADQGFTPVTDLAVTANLTRLDAARSGEIETVAAADASYAIPPGVTGEAILGGAASAFNFVEATTTGFNTIAPTVTVNTSFEGVPAGVRRFCNGELDVVFTNGDLRSEDLANCEANLITPVSARIGTQAVVLIANAASEHLTCLTTEQISTVWQAMPEEASTNWNQISPDFPDQSITLFGPNTSNPELDLLLLAASGSSLIAREDIINNNDPLYRGAATANVEGSIAVLNWFEYQDVLANNQQNIQLVAVDSGDGCVTPEVSTILDGTYALSQETRLLVNRDQLTSIGLQSLLWYAFTEQNLPNFVNNGFVGIRVSDLDRTRAALVTVFGEVILEANTAEATAEPESTDEPEATAEATEEGS